MTLSDRIAIEAGIYAKLTFEEIGRKIGKTSTAISKEIRRNSTFLKGEHPHGNDCRFATGCNKTRLCSENCKRQCVHCKAADCRQICSRYNNEPCNIRTKPPYVCNVCHRRRKCKSDRMYYIAQQADAMSQRRYSSSRSNPHIKGEELDKLNELITPLVKKGQPLTHIFSEHSDEIPISQRTLYNYIDSGTLTLKNGDLRRKVGYRSRKKKKEPTEAFINQQYRKSRTYEDFMDYISKHPDVEYVEMDTVKGVREQGKRMLTMLFVKNNIMLILLMSDGKANTVVEQFDWLTSALGLDKFRELFPIILTDNGSEFKHTYDLENTCDKKRRTKIFYCDPQASWQKPHIEKNHEYIRYVLPKGKSFNAYTQEDMVVLMNHINSTRRNSLDLKSPYELATDDKFKQLMEVMELTIIPADEINLTPQLLKKIK